MEKEIEQAVLRVVRSMYENFSEQLTIDDLARTAMFSKFHFSRVFQRVTGLSPGRFLSAVRLQEAKRLLSSTSLTVTDISHRVGYSSVGTFSSRFTSSVGIPPTGYRQSDGIVPVPFWGDGSDLSALGATTVCGTVLSPLEDQPVFIGLFPGRILEGQPISHVVLRRPGPYTLSNVPAGNWHLMGQSIIADRADAVDHPPGGDEALYIGYGGPIIVSSDNDTRFVDLRLRPMHPFDPPVLLTLRDVLPMAATCSPAKLG
ncbi:AraC family transcriptional regulator [Streptosporangium sp. NPDC005286]|uniref:AraC family transcriptional regulator n=1 Tax=Streptosporangium sp. NPDC005286 TaxID=3154463 RepID=UPI0033B6F393